MFTRKKHLIATVVFAAILRLSKYPLIEDKWIIWVSVFMPDINAIRYMNEVATWQGAMQEKAGNHQKALEIYGSQMRLDNTMLRHSSYIITRLAAQGMLVKTWKGFARWSVPGANYIHGYGLIKSPEGVKSLKQIAGSFADYAAAHQQPDLANQANGIVHYLIDDSGLPSLSSRYLAFIPLTHLNTIGYWKWVGVELLKIICIGILFWILAFLASRVIKRGVQSDSLHQQAPPKTLAIVSSIFAIGVCVSAVTIFALSKAPDKVEIFLSMFSEQFIQNGVLNSFLYILTNIIPWAVFVLVFVSCLIAAFVRMRTSTFAKADEKIGNRYLIFLGRGIYWLAVLSLQVWWTIWVLMQFIGIFSTFAFVAIPIPLILFAILYWYLRRPQTPLTLFSTDIYWLHFASWLQRSLAVLILICTVAYGVTSWAALPLRHNANQQFARVSKVGEVELMREKAQQEKPRYSEIDVKAR